MKTIEVYKLLGKRILVTRESARSLQSQLATVVRDSPDEIELDFQGVEGLTPSFLDETLSVIEICFGGIEDSSFEITIKNPPTHLSSKFAAVARGHHLKITESNGGDWIISKGEEVTHAQ